MSDDLDPLSADTALELYLDHRKGEVSEQTLQTHRYRLKSFVEWCDENDILNLNELSGRDLHAYRVERREDGGLKPVTLQGQLSTLRVFLDFCASIDAVPEDLREKILLPTVSGEEQASVSTLEYERAEAILEYLEKYKYASRQHVVFALLWRTGMRMGSLQSVDLDDFGRESPHLEIVHRPDEGTTLKNKHRGERFVALSPRLAELLEDYIGTMRHDVRDEYGREPLVATREGRPSTSSIRDWVYQATRPCIYAECPHGRDVDECEATAYDQASKCPSSRSPHDLRSGAITAHLLDDVPVEIVSDRMNVSKDILDRHYDRRSPREQMEQRRDHLRNI